jgi:hypothetical protein
MNRERAEIMEKARARKRHREDGKLVSKASRKWKALSADAPAGLTGKVVDMAQGAAAQVGAIVKTAARKITGAEG